MLQDIIFRASQFRSPLAALWRTPLDYLYRRAIDARVGEHVFFAPIYGSSVCAARCSYCAFRVDSGIPRFTLSDEEVNQEVAHLADLGYDAVYCLSGSMREANMLPINERILRASADAGLFPVLESSPFTRAGFGRLLEATEGVGRYVLFPETLDLSVYQELHNGERWKGSLADRLQQHRLALEAGWPEVGTGVLLGLTDDLQEEVSRLLAHAQLLRELGARRVTISVPRLQPASGVDSVKRCSDSDFVRIICCIRLLAPECPIVLTARESAYMRDRLWPLTHIWGVRGSTVPGGYTVRPDERMTAGQFTLSDRRSLMQILNKKRR